MELHSEASVYSGRRTRPLEEDSNKASQRVTLSEEGAHWADAVNAKLTDLCRLQVGWDGYRGVATRQDVARFAFRMLSVVLKPSTPAPSIVPLSSGGLQLEWHTDNADIELKILAPFAVEAWVSDPQLDGEGETLPLVQDYTYLNRWIQKLG